MARVEYFVNGDGFVIATSLAGIPFFNKPNNYNCDLDLDLFYCFTFYIEEARMLNIY